MAATNSETNDRKVDDVEGILLSLPQCDMERPDSGAGRGGRTGSGKTGVGTGVGSGGNQKKSLKTTTKRPDLVLFQLPKGKKGSENKNANENTNAIRDDVWKGRCKILASTKSASLVTPSTSLQLVSVGTSNALVVWKKDEENNNKSNSNSNNNKKSDATGDESPTKRRKITTAASSTSPATTAIVTPCRLIQPGGSGSSFLVGQPKEADPKELSRFFVERYKGGSSASTVNDMDINTNTNADADEKTSSPSSGAPVSTDDLCNLFQLAPIQLWRAMQKIPTVASYEKTTEGEEPKECWLLVPEEEVLFGQQALVETLCEEDDDFENDGDNDNDDRDSPPGQSSSTDATVTFEAVAAKVSQRLVPLLMDATTEATNHVTREERSLAIARKTVLLASSGFSSRTTSTCRWNDVCNRRFRPDSSRVAFYVLRDLFLKYPSYAWSDLSERWASRLPVGERYEKITSTTEWIEDPEMGGHGGLVPDQLIFSPSTPAPTDEGAGDGNGNGNGNGNSNSANETEPDASTSGRGNGGFGNAKGVLSLVDPRAVLIWRER